MACPVKVSATPLKHKSPSVKKRDLLRLVSFNMKKKEEELVKVKSTLDAKILSLEKDLIKKSNLIFKLELEVSNMKFNQKKHKPKLTMMKTSNQIIPGVPYPQKLICCQHACNSNHGQKPAEFSPPPGRNR